MVVEARGGLVGVEGVAGDGEVGKRRWACGGG